MIVGSDAVDGENCQTGVGIGGGAEHVPNEFGAISRGQVNWNGAHSSRNAFMHCFASALATKRRSVQPVAMPLIPPSGFHNAVNPPSPPLGFCLARSGCKRRRSSLWRRCRPGGVSGVRTCTLLVRRKNRGVNSADCQRMFCDSTAVWGSNSRTSGELFELELLSWLATHGMFLRTLVPDMPPSSTVWHVTLPRLSLSGKQPLLSILVSDA